MKLGARTLRGLPKGGFKQRHIIWDEEVRGFGARLRDGETADAAFTRVTFVLKYRVKGDPLQRWVTLGEWPGVDVAAVRKRAIAIKTAAALGIDSLPSGRTRDAR